ncbi:hypothetical protein [Aliikangiella coralliicola]|uniref:Uncharacterized protein n=1 Tax=Aliikangiella coralliicola TaxID=2592383 RepID=A0A545UCC5_9GAMM|nr:hypothetical protein [Aliikangiella coralliicola]TQV87118.1 hypothetical protein FLL46_15040 [Aliikangiella coralliicola]
MKILSSIAISSLLVPALQAAQPIYDEDQSYNRSTEYSYGPIERVEVNSSSNYYLEAYVYNSTGNTNCSQANILIESSYQTLNSLALTQTPFGYVAHGKLDKGYESQPKTLKLDCQNDLTENFNVYHKIPATPSINLSSSLHGSDWVPPYRYRPGFFRQLDYQGQTFIDNQSPDGSCVEGVTGYLPTLSIPSEEKFHSNSFSRAGKARYSSIFYPHLNRNIICKNSGGTTVFYERWDLPKYDPDNINVTYEMVTR